MQCPSCGTENPAKVKFCAECGSPLGEPCSVCGFRNARDASICGGCGRGLDTTRLPIAERRQITVFFADIAGSTTLAERLDPEDLRDLYAQYQNRCAEVVQRYEGHLAQYLGDGILAYFGYPAAHEDDAARAVLTGLEVLERIASVGGQRPQLRIGIHTGLVVVGDVGGGARREQLALGEAPNIAARLQSEALPDTIVISDATAKLLGGQFSLEDLGSRALKGLSRRMQIFRVLGGSGAASRFHAMKTAQGLTPMVGREREVEIIRAAWEDACAGSGRTLLLRGEAGMGKSRLLEAARQCAASRDHDVFEGQCSQYQMSSPFFPIVEMLQRHVGKDEESEVITPERIVRFAAGRAPDFEQAATALAELLGVPATDQPAKTAMSPAKRRQWMLEGVAEVLIRGASGAPVLLLIEDLHWADPSTIELLGEIVARQTTARVSLVCTTRPEFSAPWLENSNCREIQVQSLAADDTRELVARIAGPKPLPLSLREEVVARTGGIPLFVEAVTRTVIESGILRELDDRYELTAPLPPGLIPATVQDSLMARIDRLGADRPVAQLAATIGRDSSFELLQAVLDQPAEKLARALGHLVDLELVHESGIPPASTYTFRHALIQEAAYESLLRKTRQEFHGRIVEVLIRRFPGTAEAKPELLARHYEGAGRTAEAIACWIKAGHLAYESLALRECGAYMQKAIILIQTLPADDSGRLHAEMQAQLALSKCLSSTAGWGSPELKTSLVRSEELCRALNNTSGLMQTLGLLLGIYFLRGDIGRSIEAGRSLLSMALVTGKPLSEIGARHTLGYPLYFYGDFDEARRHAEKALDLYTPERERELVSITNTPSSFACGHFLALSLWFLGYPEEAEKARRRAWEVIEALDMSACTIFALGCTPMFHFARRDHRAITAEAAQLHQLSNAEGYFFFAALGRIYAGWARAMNSDVEGGIAEMNAGLEFYRTTGHGLMTPQFRLMMAEAQMRAGLLDEALTALSEGLAHAARYEEHAHEPELHRLTGEILLMRGETANAETGLRRAVDQARSQRAKMAELRAAIPLAGLLRDTGRNAEACDLLQPLSEWFQRMGDTPELRQARAMLDSLGPLAHRASVRTTSAAPG